MPGERSALWTHPVIDASFAGYPPIHLDDEVLPGAVLARATTHALPHGSGHPPAVREATVVIVAEFAPAVRPARGENQARWFPVVIVVMGTLWRQLYA